MASTQDYTPEEQAQIAEILGPLSRDTAQSYFSPMAEHYQKDISSLDMPVGGAPDSPSSDAFDADPSTAPQEAGDADILDAVGDLGDAPTEADSQESGDADILDAIGDLGGAPAEPAPQESGDLDALAGLGDLGGVAAEPAAPEMGDLGALDSPDTADPLGGIGDLGSADAGATPPDMGDLGALDSPDASDPLTGMGDLESPAAEAASPEMGDLGGADLSAAPLDMGTPESADAGDTSELFELGDLTTPEESQEGAADFGAGEPALSSELDSGLGLDSGGDLGLDAPDLSGTSAPEMGMGDDFSTPILDQSIGAGGAGDELAASLSASDISELGERAQAEIGIGEEFTDQELANIRSVLTSYPPSIRKVVIDAVVNEQLAAPEQRLLMNMLIQRAAPEELADFVEAHLGYRPNIEPTRYTKDGLEIIYADELSPEAIAKRKRRNKIVLFSTALAFLGVVGTFAALTFYRWFYVKGLYEMGIAELNKAQYSFSPAEREKYKGSAESYFQKALLKDGNRYDPEYLNRYGLAYMKARFYDQAFTKLFGRSQAPYGSFQDRNRAPLIRKVEGALWRRPLGKGTQFTDQSGQVRTVQAAGAYMVDRLRENEMQPQTLINLGRFHSNIARDFARKGDPVYKNDALAIDYYRLILSLLNQPQDVKALAGIGDVFYNQKRFLEAARQYRKIIEHSPLNIIGNAALLNSYIELAKRSNDPRAALAKHRELRKLGLEEELPIYLMTKLAALYGQLNAEDVLIKYQIDPIDRLNNQDLKDNARHLLELAFEKTELRDDEEIVGSRYAEGFYQRGLFLLGQKENRRALLQFQKAHNYDPLHYLAVNQMGDHYKNIRDFERSAQYYAKAIEIYKQFIPFGGRRPEDETLLEGDIAQVYYNAGSLLFLRYAGFTNRKDLGFPNTRLYPFRAQKVDAPEISQRRQRLAQAKEYFQEAQALQLKDPQSQAHLQYWSGWIDYMNSNFNSAIKQWEAIDSLRQNRDAALLIGKANSYYYTDQLRNSLGHYLKVKSDLEKESHLIKTQHSSVLNDQERQMLLIAVYNNIGAIYEKEAQELAANLGKQSKRFRELEKDSLLYYWKAIEAARKAKLDNEIARTNVQLAFRRGSQRREPLIDDWLLPVLPTLKHKF